MIYLNKHSVVWAMNSGYHENWEGMRAEVHLHPMVYSEYILTGTVHVDGDNVVLVCDDGSRYLVAFSSGADSFSASPFLVHFTIHVSVPA